MNSTEPTNNNESPATAGGIGNDHEHDPHPLPPTKDRDPFFAFIPHVASWAGGIVANELKIAQHAVTVAPSWTVKFLTETVEYYKENPRILFSEIISGFTVAIMQVPESIAFSFVAGVPPLSGLQATFWMALITGIFGGKPGMISGTFVLVCV